MDAMNFVWHETWDMTYFISLQFQFKLNQHHNWNKSDGGEKKNPIYGIHIQKHLKKIRAWCSAVQSKLIICYLSCIIRIVEFRRAEGNVGCLTCYFHLIPFRTLPFYLSVYGLAPILLSHLISPMQNQIKAKPLFHPGIECWNHGKIPLTFNIQPNYWPAIKWKRRSPPLSEQSNEKFLEERVPFQPFEESGGGGAEGNKNNERARTQSFAKTMVASE